MRAERTSNSLRTKFSTTYSLQQGQDGHYYAYLVSSTFSLALYCSVNITLNPTENLILRSQLWHLWQLLSLTKHSSLECHWPTETGRAASASCRAGLSPAVQVSSVSAKLKLEPHLPDSRKKWSQTYTCSLSSLFLEGINEQHPFLSSAEAYSFPAAESGQRTSSELLSHLKSSKQQLGSA